LTNKVLMRHVPKIFNDDFIYFLVVNFDGNLRNRAQVRVHPKMNIKD